MQEEVATQKIGYQRVSTIEQNVDRQLEGFKFHKLFTDYCSGKDTDRPELKKLFDYVREGDVLFVHSMDRLARNVDDLRKIVSTLTKRGVEIFFVKENLRFGRKEDAMSQLLLTVMGAFAEFERAIIRERQREGIMLAKKKGKYKGRKPSLSQEKIEELVKRSIIENKSKLAREFYISRATLYKYIKKI